MNVNPFYPQAGDNSAPYNMSPANAGISRFRNWMDELGAQYSEDFFIYQANVASLGPGLSVSVNIPIQHDSAFEWMFTSGGSLVNTGGLQVPRVVVQVADQTSGRNLFSNPIPLPCCAGNLASSGPGQYFVNPIPRRFMSKTNVLVTFTSLETVSTTVNLSLQLIGRKIFANRGTGHITNVQNNMRRFRQWTSLDDLSGQQRVYSEDLFCYDFLFPTLAPAATATVTQLIEADSDFEWITCVSSAINNATGGLIFAGQWSNQISIVDGGSQRSLQGSVSSGSNNITSPIIGSLGLLGNSTFPFILPVPRIFLAKTNVAVTVSNIDTAITVTENHVTMWGRKIFTLS